MPRTLTPNKTTSRANVKPKDEIMQKIIYRSKKIDSIINKAKERGCPYFNNEEKMREYLANNMPVSKPPETIERQISRHN